MGEDAAEQSKRLRSEVDLLRELVAMHERTAVEQADRMAAMLAELTAAKEAAEAGERRTAACLEVIRALSTPILPIHPGILVLPLVGEMDEARGVQLMETLLDGVQRHRGEVVLLDVTGVTGVDAGVIRQVLRAVAAAGLLGARCVLVGASPGVARGMIASGVDLADVRAHRDLEAGFRAALAERGLVIAGR